jgi:hypothetical protein
VRVCVCVCVCLCVCVCVCVCASAGWYPKATPEDLQSSAQEQLARDLHATGVKVFMVQSHADTCCPPDMVMHFCTMIMNREPGSVAFLSDATHESLCPDKFFNAASPAHREGRYMWYRCLGIDVCRPLA